MTTWTQETFDKLVSGEPEPLRSHFRVNHQMVMSLLDRPTRDGIDGCRAVRRLLTDNHESRKRQREHIRRTIAIYRSLVEAELLEFPEHPDEWGRLVRVNFDLQDEFAVGHVTIQVEPVGWDGEVGCAGGGCESGTDCE